jgi:hypothetical protein
VPNRRFQWHAAAAQEINGDDHWSWRIPANPGFSIPSLRKQCRTMGQRIARSRLTLPRWENTMGARKEYLP